MIDVNVGIAQKVKIKVENASTHKVEAKNLKTVDVEPKSPVSLLVGTADTAKASVVARNAVLVSGGSKECPMYTGKYLVMPRAKENVVLPTKGKRMAENITVKEIPYYEIANNSGGKTAFIADISKLEVL